MDWRITLSKTEGTKGYHENMVINMVINKVWAAAASFPKDDSKRKHMGILSGKPYCAGRGSHPS